MSNSENSFIARKVKKVLVPSDLRDTLISKDTTLIEQRLLVTILSALKDPQSKFIGQKLPASNKVKQNFEGYFTEMTSDGDIEFIVPIDELNPKRTMRNQAIKKALINLTNINWFTLRDETIDGYRAVPFILMPRWNKGNIFFKMDKTVLKSLLTMTQYFPILRDLPYKVSSSKTFAFLLWTLKFQKIGIIRKSYQELLQELHIDADKYESRTKFERDYLMPIKADLDSYNDKSFTYTFNNGIFTIILKNTEVIAHKKESREELKISQSLKYYKNKRNLSDSEVRTLNRLYEVGGHEALARKIKSKIDPILEGSEFIKGVFSRLEE